MPRRTDERRPSQTAWRSANRRPSQTQHGDKQTLCHSIANTVQQYYQEQTVSVDSWAVKHELRLPDTFIFPQGILHRLLILCIVPTTSATFQMRSGSRKETRYRAKILYAMVLVILLCNCTYSHIILLLILRIWKS